MKNMDSRFGQSFATERRIFADPQDALSPEGLVAVGGDLNVSTLFEAYSFGIFPWPHDDHPLLWFCPEQRGVLDFAQIHVSQTLVKFLKQMPWKISFDQDFAQVMRRCASTPRPQQAGTWITPAMELAYIEFHKAGFAHSIECWEGDELVGGLYGTYVGGVFSGESMFHARDNASKVCLYALTEFLQGQGLRWMDIQMVSEALKPWGGKYIHRREFLERVRQAHLRPPAINWPREYVIRI